MRNYTSSAPRFRSQRIRLCVGLLLLGVLTVLHAPLRAAIALSAVTPLGASAGVTVQITGSGFAPVAANNQVVLTPSSGPAVSGLLVERSDFYVTFRQADGTIRVVPTTGANVVTTNPLQAHVDLLDRISDTQIHDLVAYLEKLK